MTEEQRQHRSAFIREQPFFWFFVSYSVAFLSFTVATDVVRVANLGPLNWFSSYVMSFGVALPLWIGLRGWARRVEAEPQSDVRA